MAPQGENLVKNGPARRKFFPLFSGHFSQIGGPWPRLPPSGYGPTYRGNPSLLSISTKKKSGPRTQAAQIPGQL
jgi:hypothetical protein